MTAADLRAFFNDRADEINEYLRLLDSVEAATRTGAPQIVGSQKHITVHQQKILYSSVYLQLYNLVEATVARCVEELTDAVARERKWKLDDLSSTLRREWVRSVARTHVEQAPDKRLETFLDACARIIDQLPVEKFAVEKGGGGNWDDESIYVIFRRIGCDLRLTAETRRAVKQKLRNNLGALQLVKSRRNELAHGEISFVECADGVALSDLRQVADAVTTYLREVVECFISYVEMFGYLRPDRKPVGAP